MGQIEIRKPFQEWPRLHGMFEVPPSSSRQVDLLFSTKVSGIDLGSIVLDCLSTGATFISSTDSKRNEGSGSTGAHHFLRRVWWNRCWYSIPLHRWHCRRLPLQNQYRRRQRGSEQALWYHKKIESAQEIKSAPCVSSITEDCQHTMQETVNLLPQGRLVDSTVWIKTQNFCYIYTMSINLDENMMWAGNCVSFSFA